jgi:ABC-type dipeptide/oligopeptide/nickel transport system permease subunit
MPFFSANTIPALRNRVRRQPLAVAGVLLLAAFVLGGLTAPWLAPANPAAIDLAHRLESPSVAHWAGTDELGRDTLSRLLYGARLSLAVSVTVVAISLALGLAVGGLAGYLGGWIDIALTTFAMNTFLALPGILLAIAFAAFLGPGFSNLVLAWPSAAGPATPAWCARRSCPCATASTWTRPVPWAQAACASSSATFCRISSSRFWCRPPSAWPV